jgi:hypothetical protein
VTLASAIFTTRSRSGSDESGFFGLTRAAKETAALLLALAVVGGFIIYKILPLGQEDLYHQAELLMASTRRSDWRTAIEEYIDPLDERFPSNPYREQTRKWRDKILLDEADGRASILLTSPIKSLKEPKNRAESQFVIYHTLAAEASGRHDDLTAVRQWQELALLLKPKSEDPKTDEPDERKWYLLALHNKELLENAIRDRRQYVEKQLEIAAEAIRNGQPNQARTIHLKLAEQYAGFTDLADYFPSPPPSSGLQPSPPAPPGHPAPTEPRPGSPAAHAADPAAAATPVGPDSTPPAATVPNPKNDRPSSPTDPDTPPDSRPSREVDQRTAREFRN